MKQDRSPEKTGQSWALLAVGRDPEVRGMCPYGIGKVIKSLAQRLWTEISTMCSYMEAKTNHSRFRSVQGVRAVPHILGTVENTEGQTSEEITWGQVTCHRSDGKSSSF